MDSDNLCSCGSGLAFGREYDAQGIYLCRACYSCRDERLSHYRKEILTGYSQDDVDEPIDGDDSSFDEGDFYDDCYD